MYRSESVQCHYGCVPTGVSKQRLGIPISGFGARPSTGTAASNGPRLGKGLAAPGPGAAVVTLTFSCLGPNAHRARINMRNAPRAAACRPGAANIRLHQSLASDHPSHGRAV